MPRPPARSNHESVANGTPKASESTRRDRPASKGNVVADDAAKLVSVQGLSPGAGEGGSGVYIVEREPSEARTLAAKKARKAMNPLLEQVTLVVYGWQNVEPGTLSWVFPSVGTAVAAARAMKNAVRWAIVAGRRSNDADDEADDGAADQALDEARANGAVLVEQAG
jgi:hypothetical protein